MAVDFAAARLAVVADAALSARELSSLLVSVTDDYLRKIFAGATGEKPDGVALVAVGGYGRNELCPGSDLDLLLLHTDDRKTTKRVVEIAEKVWYPIWDAGVKLGHAVRTEAQALALAVDDLDTATALLSARHVAGDETLTKSLREHAKTAWKRRGVQWLGRLVEARDDRHSKAGDVAFLLEPDLKGGWGGLRDVQVIRWANSTGKLSTPPDEARLAEAYEVLFGARCELHRITGRPNDVLRLEDQDAVARVLGDANADVLMARISSAARTIAWLGDEVFDRVEVALGLAPEIPDGPVETGIVIRDRAVHLTADALVSRHPTIALRAGIVATRLGTRIDRASLERIATELPVLTGQWPADMADALVELLLEGHAAIPALEALDQVGALVKILPEWAPVRNRPQRNVYHRFTVDRHLFEAAAEAAKLADRVERKDLLVIGAWLHDIGKGYPGDHTEVGINLVHTIANRMGFNHADAAVLGDMVRFHLLLPDVATRRDLSDDATITAVATAIGSQSTLDLLDALTEADSKATGLTAWGNWKAELVRELIDKTSHVLGGGLPADLVATVPTQEHRRIMDRREFTVLGHGDTLTVVTVDRPGTFRRVAGVLALRGLDVLGADAYSDDTGMALSVFRVAVPPLGEPDWDRVVEDLTAALRGRLAVESRLDERVKTYAKRSKAKVGATASQAPKVVFDNDATPSATVLEVRCVDGIGVLYRIARALAEMMLDIRTAKVATLGHDIVDTFYVRDVDGNKILDEDTQREIERAIRHGLA